MEKITDSKLLRNTTLLFTMMYFTSYISRINFGAIIVEMERTTNISKSILSLAITGSFITYGGGQIISGICGDKFQPKALVFIGLLVTACTNAIIPFCTSPYLMTAVWCVNGFAQAFMWPPLVKLMTTLFTDDYYNTATVRISWGSSLGTIAVYLFSPVIISVGGWKCVFWFCSLCAVIMAIVWNKKCVNIAVYKSEEKQSSNNKSSLKVLFTPLMLFIMIAIIAQGALRDGVTTWMPSYISETYNLGSKISILTGVLLPIFSIISFQLTEKLHKNIFKNPILCAGVLFCGGTICSVCLAFTTGSSAIMSVLLSALMTGFMHGVNIILICFVPRHFEKYGNVSTVSGVLNACTYIGSALSTYGIAVISENMGWSTTLVVWSAVAIIGTAICFIFSSPWSRFERQ